MRLAADLGSFGLKLATLAVTIAGIVVYAQHQVISLVPDLPKLPEFSRIKWPACITNDTDKHKDLKDKLSCVDAVILVIGETGEGKSTLINGLKVDDGKDAATGRNPAGVTKDFRCYYGMVGTKKVAFIDPPGIGDKDVPYGELVSLLKQVLSGGVDGVILCSQISKCRVTIGAHFMQIIVEQCISGPRKWESIILCGTHADRCSNEEIADFKSMVKDEFNKEIKDGGKFTKVVVTSGRQGTGLMELKSALQELPSGKLTYKEPDTQQLLEAVSRATGVVVENPQLQLAAAGIFAFGAGLVATAYGWPC